MISHGLDGGFFCVLLLEIEIRYYLAKKILLQIIMATHSRLDITYSAAFVFLSFYLDQHNVWVCDMTLIYINVTLCGN